jgi:hypothetical protein
MDKNENKHSGGVPMNARGQLCMSVHPVSLNRDGLDAVTNLYVHEDGKVELGVPDPDKPVLNLYQIGYKPAPTSMQVGKQKSDPYYYVYRVGDRRGPVVKHWNLDSAVAESQRLSRQHPGDLFELLKCVGQTRTTEPVTKLFDDEI